MKLLKKQVHNEKTQGAIENALSTARFEPYSRLAVGQGQPPEYALELYLKNLTACKEFYAAISGFEVVLRNAMHRSLIGFYGKEDWYDGISWHGKHRGQLDEAKQRASFDRKTVYPDDVVAHLMLGFWVNLLSDPYEKSLWTPALRKAFPFHQGKPSRKVLRQHFVRILILRNRIAHYEPLIKQKASWPAMLHDITEGIRWISPETACWLSAHLHLPE